MEECSPMCSATTFPPALAVQLNAAAGFEIFHLQKAAYKHAGSKFAWL